MAAAGDRPIDVLLARLEHVRQRGDDYRAKCPAHDGKSRDSLSIKEVTMGAPSFIVTAAATGRTS